MAKKKQGKGKGKGKKRVVSKSGRVYEKHEKTGKWIHVHSYDRHGPHKHKK